MIRREITVPVALALSFVTAGLMLVAKPAETAGPAPGMSLSAPTSALLNQTFVLTIKADPAPSVAVSQFASEVELPTGLQWIQRTNCAASGATGEVKPTVNGAAPAVCARITGPAGEPRHYVASAVQASPLPALGPMTTLVELDVKCSALGTFTVTLTAAWQDPFGALYVDINSNEIFVKTSQVGGVPVADTHQVSCLDPTVDSDLDGCRNEQELGSNQAIGGRRDPLNFWDFYDVPTGTWPNVSRNKAVAASDYFAVLARSGSSGSTAIDPLSPPAAPPAYHTAYDRTAPQAGADAWDSGAPDGVINSIDASTVLAQFGHTCA